MPSSTIIESRFKASPQAVLLTFNRPERRNALTEDDMQYLCERLASFHHDPTVSAIVVTGAGDAFTSGQDIREINDNRGARLRQLLERDLDVLTRVVTMPKPVVAAVNGVSAGFGNHLAICSDLCLVRDTATFNFTGIRKGIPSPMLGSLLLGMTIGLKRAKGLFLRGGRYLPSEALADGFCNEVIDEDGWDKGLEGLAQELCSRDSEVVALNKYILNQPILDALGASRLSVMAGAGIMSHASAFPTGRA
jgi:enoyl-CoA hydratase/carnithine racemase